MKYVCEKCNKKFNKYVSTCDECDGKVIAKKTNRFLGTLILILVTAIVSSLATYQFMKENSCNNKGNVNLKGSWYSTYAGSTFMLSLTEDGNCEYGYEDADKTKCTYEYSNEVLQLKTSEGTDKLIYNLEKDVLYINSSPYYNSKETSSKNDAYYYVPEGYDISMFTKITPEEFISKFNNGDEMFVLTARSSCQHCQDFRPIAAQTVESHNYKLYYLDTATLTDTTYANIKALDTKLNETFGATPNVYYVKGKKVVDTNEGATTLAQYTQFIETHGVKKK